MSDAAALLAEVLTGRAAPVGEPLEQPPLHPEELCRRWALAAGLSTGCVLSPTATQLAGIARAWGAARGWDAEVHTAALGRALRSLGIRPRCHNGARGYAVTRESAATLWALVGGRPPSRRTPRPREPKPPPRPPPLVSAWRGPVLLDSLGTVWAGPGDAARQLRLAASRVVSDAVRLQRPLAGRLWRRLEAHEVAALPPGLLSGQRVPLHWAPAGQP